MLYFFEKLYKLLDIGKNKSIFKPHYLLFLNKTIMFQNKFLYMHLIKKTEFFKINDYILTTNSYLRNMSWKLNFAEEGERLKIVSPV